jgi:hypothetical protein
MNGEVSRKTTQVSENLGGGDRSSSPSSPWALELDVFASRYGDLPAEAGNEVREGARQITREQHGFEYVQPQGRCPFPAGTASCQLASVRAQTAGDSSAPWMVPMSQHHSKRHHQAKHRGKAPRQLFQYKPYEAQEPLHLLEDEMAAVVSAVFSSESAELHEARDAGIVILIKVIMDIFLDKGAEAAFGQVSSLLRKPLVRKEEDVVARCAVFDVIVNLLIHGELLYGQSSVDPRGGQAARGMGPEGAGGDGAADGSWMETVKRQTSNAHWLCEEISGAGMSSSDEAAGWQRMDAFRAWLRRILFDLLDAFALSRDCDAAQLSAGSSADAEVWSSALSCVMSLCTRDGFVVRAWVDALPPAVLKQMLQVSRTNFWSTKIQSLLACIACNVMYASADGGGSVLDRTRLDGFGGIAGVVKEYQYAPTGIACSSLFCLLLDSVGTPDGVARAMSRCGAAEALRHYLVLPGLASDEDVDENLARSILSMCLSYDDLSGVEFDDVLACIRSLKDAASTPYDVPRDLEEAFEATLEAGVFGQTDSRHWNTLRSMLVSTSAKERIVGRSWMVKLMLSVLDACVTEPTEKNAIIPPPVPLLPSNIPGPTLFTFGDTILSSFAQESSRQRSRSGDGGTFVSAADSVVTNFALAVRQVVGGIRFRTLQIDGNLHTKWNGGGVDTDRLCISTIERAFEWIMGFSSAPEWSSAIALMVESMIQVVSNCSKTANLMHMGGRLPPSTPRGDIGGTSGSASDTVGRSQSQTPDGPAAMPPLRIPSPSSVGPVSPSGSNGPLSPLTKIVPGLWRRLRTPGSRAQKDVRPNSGESQSSNTDIYVSSGAERPLSAGVMAMDAGGRDHGEDRPTQVLGTTSALKTMNASNNVTEMAPASRIGSITAQVHNTQWKSLAERVTRAQEQHQRETLQCLSVIGATVHAYNRTVDPIESFVAASSTCSPAMLDMLSPQNLKDVFDAMSQTRADVVQLGMCDAGKPFWDARLAVFILLVFSCTQTEKNRHNHPLLKSAGYAQSLVRDPDLRVRHHACAFLLHRFSEINTGGFIKATRTIISRAQQSDEESLLIDPELRVRKMMDLNMINFDELMV